MTRILTAIFLISVPASVYAQEYDYTDQETTYDLSSGSTCLVGPDVFDYSPFRDNLEAEQLAIVLSGQLRAPDEEYERILRDLQLIRTVYPEIKFITGRANYSPNTMLIRLIEGEPEDEYNALNEFYQMVEDDIIFHSLNIHLLTFCGSLNIPLLSSFYVAPNILRAGPDGTFGGQGKITVERIDSFLRYSIRIGCGDCLGGCINNRRWTIDVDDTGNLTLVSFVNQQASCFVDCCLPLGECLNVTEFTCRMEGGTEVAECLGDNNCDGLDDACSPAPFSTPNDDTLASTTDPCFFQIEIDIIPGSDINSLQLGVPGDVPVAILTTNIADGDLEDFDVAKIDTTSLSLAGAYARPRDEFGHAGMLEDIDGDGDLDLLLHFPMLRLDLTEGDTQATLTGLTLHGAMIFDDDIVSTRRFPIVKKSRWMNATDEFRRLRYFR